MRHTRPLIAGTALLLTLTAGHAPAGNHADQAFASMKLQMYAVPSVQSGKSGRIVNETLLRHLIRRSGEYQPGPTTTCGDRAS
jgi:hypothetical protein